jgi:Flp pilus assembly protein TadG
MFGSFARLRRNSQGASAVEFALMLPVFLLVTAGMIDLGRALYQTNAVEKGLRAGAMYAARNSYPLTLAQKTETENIVKKGNRAGTGKYLVEGWSDPTSLNISTTTEVVDGTPVPIYHFDAAVPFDPLLPGLLTALNLDDIKITLSHEQAYIGY